MEAAPARVLLVQIALAPPSVLFEALFLPLLPDGNDSFRLYGRHRLLLQRRLALP